MNEVEYSVDFDLETRKLEKLRQILIQEIAVDPFLHDCKVDISPMIRYMKNSFAVRLIKEFWTENLGEYEFTTPLDWWEHFKERWFSKKLLKYFPIQYRKERVNLRVIYPEFNAVVPKDQLYIPVVIKK